MALALPDESGCDEKFISLAYGLLNLSGHKEHEMEQG